MKRLDSQSPELPSTALGRRAFLSRAGLLGAATAMAPAFASAILGTNNAGAITLPPPGVQLGVRILNFSC